MRTVLGLVCQLDKCCTVIKSRQSGPPENGNKLRGMYDGSVRYITMETSQSDVLRPQETLDSVVLRL